MTIHLKTMLPPPLWLPTRTAGPRRACGRYRPRPTCPARGPYLALLPVGLAVPVLLPAPRWALTPPFHPYPRASPWRSAGGFFSVALSLGLPRPGVTRHRCLVESGLSSHGETLRFPHKRPSGPPRNSQLSTLPAPVNGKARSYIGQHGHVASVQWPTRPRPPAQAQRSQHRLVAELGTIAHLRTQIAEPG